MLRPPDISLIQEREKLAALLRSETIIGCSVVAEQGEAFSVFRVLSAGMQNPSSFEPNVG
jgi:hypothetical protein